MTTTVSDAMGIFLNHCRYEKKLSTKTIKAYTTDLTQFTGFLSTKQVSTIAVITKHEIRAYLEQISDLKPKSIKRKIATIKALFNFLEFDDLIVVNPFRKMKIQIREPRVLPTVLELGEVSKILKRLYADFHQIVDKSTYSYKEALRNAVVIELLFATGGRVSEIAGLLAKNINLSDGSVLLYGKGSKERLVQVCNGETLKLLITYKKVWSGAIESSGGYFLVNRVGKCLSTQSIRNLVAVVVRKTGLTKHITPHTFRHSFATLLLERDVDIKYIQSLLGHSSIMTTQLYTHVNQTKQRQLLKAKHPRRDMMMGGG
jgi:integrase/recombinase XerD